MTWIQYGDVWSGSAEVGGDEQLGKAASIRFIRPELDEDGLHVMVTVYAYPHAPERSVEKTEGSVTTFYGFEPDMDSLGVQSQIEFMLCEDVDDPGGTESWSNYRYESLDTRPYTRGDDKDKIMAAEVDALRFIETFDANRNIHWDGERF